MLSLQRFANDVPSSFRLSSAEFINVGFFLNHFSEIAEFNWKLFKVHLVNDLCGEITPQIQLRTEETQIAIDLFSNICKLNALIYKIC